jgi:hypothetical protein
MTAEIQDTRLIIKIENKQPIELLDLTKSLVSLAAQFDKFVSKHGDTKENREAKLYVKEIKTGSVIVELIELATVGVIPFAENTNTILDFAVYLKKAITYYLKNEGEKPELSVSDCKDFNAILAPTAKDNGSQLNVSTTINGNVQLHLHLNSLDANSMQELLKKEIEASKTPDTMHDIKEREILIWYQARNDPKSLVGNKAIVENISEKPMNVIFETDEIKNQMLHSDINPFNTAFVVDLKIQNIKGIPRVYRILKLHEYFEIDDNKIQSNEE